MVRGKTIISISGLAFALTIGGCVSVSVMTPFHLIDKRPAAEREGFPYPTSWFSYTMHGDTSLQVDRLVLLQTRFADRFGQTHSHETLTLQKFFVMESLFRDSFVRDASGKAVANQGPYEPTLIAEIVVFVDDWPFVGYSQLSLPHNSTATHTTLTKVTSDAVDEMLNNMELHWIETGKRDAYQHARRQRDSGRADPHQPSQP